ncbi:MAG: nuclear transport factor 2 family protein [Chitinophagaceae bacterium]
MKNIYRIISLLIFTVTITLASSAQSKAEKQVASLVEELRKAMIDPEKTKFEKIVSDDLSYGHSGGKVEDKAAFMDAYLKGRSDFVSIDLTDQSIKIYGKTAIVRHKLSGVTNDNNKPGTVNLIILYVWHKEKSNWKLLARQAVKG